jgi:hypothetical protein
VEKLDVRGNAYLENNSIFMSGYNEGSTNNTVYSQYVGKRYSGRILAGMEIENVRTNSTGTAITTDGDYGQKLHFRAHDYGIYGGLASDRAMTIVGSKVGIGTTSPASKLDVNGSFYSTLNSSTANYSFYNNIGSDAAWRSAFSIGSTAIGIFTVMSYSAGYSQVSAIWWYQYKAGGTSGYVSRLSGSTSPDFRLNGQTVEHNGNGGTHFTQLRVFPFAI